MAALYSGQTEQPLGTSEFNGLDEEAVTNVGTAGQPLDVYLDTLLRDSEHDIITRPDSCGWTPLSGRSAEVAGFDGIRPYASGVGFSSVLELPILVHPGLKRIQWIPVARVATESLDAGDRGLPMPTELVVRGSVSGSVVRAFDNVQDTATPFRPRQGNAGSGDLGPEALSLTLVERARTSGLARVSWRIASERSVTPIDTTTGGVRRFGDVAIETDDGFYDYTAAGPAPTSLDIQGSVIGGVLHEHLWPVIDIGAGPGDPVDNKIYTSPIAPVGVGVQAARHHLQYIQVKSGTLLLEYEDATHPTDSVYASGIPVLSEAEVLHPLRTDTTYLRPRLRWVGPLGEEVTGEAYPPGFVERYTRREAAPAASPATSVMLASASLWLDTVDPELVVLGLVIPVHVEGVAGGVAEALEARTVVPWQVYVTVERMDDGDTAWSQATTIGSGETTPTEYQAAHIPLVADPTSPFLLTEWMRDFSYLGSLADFWGFREGQLFDADRDLPDLIATRVRITHDPKDETPVRLRLWAVGPESEDDVPWALPGGRDLEALRLVLAGATIWEVPR